MGGGYYLGESRYSGWIIQKVPVYDREHTIREFGYTAGDEANIRLKAPAAEPNPEDGQIVIKGEFMIVDYSEKAIALFGDTRPIKDALAALGGRVDLPQDPKRAGESLDRSIGNHHRGGTPAPVYPTANTAQT